MVTFDELYEKIGRLVLILTLTAKSKLTTSNIVYGIKPTSVKVLTPYLTNIVNLVYTYLGIMCLNILDQK